MFEIMKFEIWKFQRQFGVKDKGKFVAVLN
jgi:hypothetical protein